VVLMSWGSWSLVAKTIVFWGPWLHYSMDLYCVFNISSIYDLSTDMFWTMSSFWIEGSTFWVMVISFWHSIGCSCVLEWVKLIFFDTENCMTANGLPILITGSITDNGYIQWESVMNKGNREIIHYTIYAVSMSRLANRIQLRMSIKWFTPHVPFGLISLGIYIIIRECGTIAYSI